MAAGSAELERFIEQALIAGHPRAAVQRALLDAGWSQPQIDGANWLISRVVHQLDSSGGYTNSLELEVMLDELPE